VRATVVILTKLPGHLPVMTRLRPVLGEQRATDFYRECLEKTIALARSLEDAEVVVAYSPADARPPHPLYRPVRGADGAQCLENALRDAYVGAPLIALGGDAPDLPRDRIEEVIAALDEHDAAFVPTGDGGFSCLGLRSPVDGLRRGFLYGGEASLASLRGWLTERGLSCVETEPWPDIDTPEDYAAYRARSKR